MHERNTQTGDLESREAPFVEPVMDLPAVEAALRMSGVHEDDHLALLELFEALFLAAHRTWETPEIQALEVAAAGGPAR